MKSIYNSVILITGLARDCSLTIERDLSIIGSAFSCAKKLIYLVIESDSSDNTSEILCQIRSRLSDFYYVSLGNLRDIYPKRTERIALCRNHYIKMINESDKFSAVDYVVVADLDGINSRLTVDAVRSCWSRNDWDVCCSNQSGPYYDIWALRHHLWSPNDCWRQAEFLRNHGLSTFQAVVSSVYSRMIIIDKSSSWIEVDSAFGGLAIYKTEFIKSKFYIGLDESGNEICEHVSLHEKIRSEGGRIFINPAFINNTLVDHARYATRAGLYKFWLRCQIADLKKQIGKICHL